MRDSILRVDDEDVAGFLGIGILGVLPERLAIIKATEGTYSAALSKQGQRLRTKYWRTLSD